MSDERPESLLKSALEKIVYFEARSTQLSNDLERERVEAERLKGELGQAAQREIELRRVIAELEVRTTRAHGEREEAARLVDALRRERADLIGKMLDASRIHGAGDGIDDFDLAQFIAQLRSEVLLTRDGPVATSATQSPPRTAEGTPAVVAREVEGTPARLTAKAVTVGASGREAPLTELVTADAADAGAVGDGERAPLVPPPVVTEAAAERVTMGAVPASAVQRTSAPSVGESTPARAQGTASTMAALTRAAHELSAQGRLSVSSKELDALTGARAFPGRSEETLFGFSVRELSAPDASARARAAERLLALAHPAAAPALASALHSETEPSVQVALLAAFSSLAKSEGVPVVQPLLTSRAPDVRIAALKALLTLDAAQAGPHLAAAMSDPDKAVRRRASLLALGLDAKQALELGTKAIKDADPDVRALAALVLGASQADAARPMLLEVMRDRDLRVRRSASQALSRLLGKDVTGLVELDDAQRRREVRRLAHLPAKAPLPVASSSTQPPESSMTGRSAPAAHPGGRVATASRVSLGLASAPWAHSSGPSRGAVSGRSSSEAPSSASVRPARASNEALTSVSGRSPRSSSGAPAPVSGRPVGLVSGRASAGVPAPSGDS
ncbi:MAG: HEAT repeat domain-containing protein, partial [Myxococcota bacterium]